MNERKLSDLQKAYRSFFLEKMRLYGVISPADLSKEKKINFFTEIKQEWPTYKHTQKGTFKEILVQEIPPSYGERPEQETIKNDYFPQQDRKHQNSGTSGKVFVSTIRSKPNPEQTSDLKILYQPNKFFFQEGQYLYPVVKMPQRNSFIKLPRIGRSNQKGYKENDFFNQIKQKISGIEISDNFHLVIPNFNRPYEPDIVLFDKNLKLYIDIEIDEPYDGHFRYPTHFIDPESEFRKDDIRDLFFLESGWIVLRLTEKQVHLQSSECIEYIKNVLNSIYGRFFTSNGHCEMEEQWDYNQSIQWQKYRYRENYLGIPYFNVKNNYSEIVIDSEYEDIEQNIHRTKQFSLEVWNSSIAFDEASHTYHKNETGNAEFISVTTLIERFFPFDLKRYIEKKAAEENRTEEDVLYEYFMIRDEAAEKGTFLHKQIENFLKKLKFDSHTKEFQMFLNFYDKEIKQRKLTFYDAEKIIYSYKHNIAGTIDCLFKKTDCEDLVMIDWKRSKKLIIDGRPRIYGYGYAHAELNTLDNSSYNRYCLQQNIYKYILETEYSLKVSSMLLVVLHENYTNYCVVKVPEMNNETKIILKSLKLKI